MTSAFRQSGPLGVSVVLFFIMGALWVFVWLLAVPLHKRGSSSTMLFVSGRADTAYFGDSPGELLAADPAFDKFRTMLITVNSGSLVMAGIMFMLVAWFGLGRGYPWALVSLALGVVLAVVFWALALSVYPRAGVRLTLADVPPFMWVPAVLVVPATILGWVGLK